jgi:transcriptional regulator with XRE-family HTH domain
MNQMDAMAKPLKRAYSRYNLEALDLLAKMIRAGRISRRMTGQEMASRAGISRSLLQRIEKGDPTCAIGAVFEVAILAGVPLFESDAARLQSHSSTASERLSLLPKSARRPRRVVHDDF